MAKQQSSYGGRWILDDEQQKMIFVVEAENRPIPNQIVRLPDPPTDCDNSQMIMSDGSITMTSFDHDDDHDDDANKIYQEDDNNDEIENSENNNEDYDYYVGNNYGIGLDNDVDTDETTNTSSTLNGSGSGSSGDDVSTAMDTAMLTDLEEGGLQHRIAILSMRKQQQQRQRKQQQQQQQQSSKSSLRKNKNNNGSTQNDKKKKVILFVEPKKKAMDSMMQQQKQQHKEQQQKQQHKKDNKNSKNRVACCHIMMYCIVGLALFAIVVGGGISAMIYFGVINVGNGSSIAGTTIVYDNDSNANDYINSDSDSSNNINPTRLDDDATVVTEPVATPNTSNDKDTNTNTVTDTNADTPSTLNPTVSEERTMMIDILTNQFHIAVLPSSPAVNWLLEELQLYPELKLTYYDDLTKFAQRFALVTMKFSLLGDEDDGGDQNGNSIEQKQGVDECNWYGIECDFYGRVIEVDYSDNNLSGSIPSSEIKLLYHLETLDLSNNEITGSIPEEIYDLRSLQHVYLYHNKLTGTISSYISQLLSYGSLQTLHLSHNSLTGSIPSFQQQQLDSSGTSSLTYLNLYDNKLTGTIPRNLRLNELKYFDIGRNFIGGSIPEDIGIDFLKLRYLHIDHNRLTDNIPDTIPSMANGRLISFLANNNRLEGYVPDNYIMYNKLVQYTLQNNYFDYLGPDNCFLNVFQGGELVEFKADCNICSCDDIFCNTMCS